MSFEYTKEELEALEYYSSRKPTELDKLDYGYENINKFLRYLSMNGHRDKRMPIIFPSIEEFKSYLKNIVDLYILSCKYGINHTPPARVYRGDYAASNIDRYSYNDILGDKVWDTDSFVSTSKSKAEVKAIVGDEAPIIEIDIKKPVDGLDYVPFIDVNDLLGSDQFFGDEKEILFPPFLKAIVNRVSLLDYSIDMTSISSIPSEPVELTEDFLAAYLELSNRCHEAHKIDDPEVNQALENFRIKLKEYLQDKLSLSKFLIARVANGFMENSEYEKFIEEEFILLSPSEGIIKE